LAKKYWPETHLWRHGLSLDDAMQAWVEVTPALVVNRPSAMAANGSKPFQAAQIREAGFYVPETLITTDEAAVREFSDRHGSVIYKSVSGVRSIVSRLGPAHRGRLADVANCPTQFQEYIAGADFRVHVVGEAIFAAEIVSDADDYRYASRAGRSTRIRAFTLEPDLADRCRRLAAQVGLPVAGIDLRRTQEGRWCCFEVNPSPGFTFYQEATGQKIAQAIADMLVNCWAGTTRTRSESPIKAMMPSRRSLMSMCSG
jgi:glutathione synthase/RimK-type ligase-like ATP-grasp enzyme